MIARQFVDEIVAHAREGAPEEVCGVLAGKGDRVMGLYRIMNAEHSQTRYLMDSQEQLRAVLDIDNKGLEVLGIYHSHPATEPRPSKTDEDLANWPGAEYIIVSLRHEDDPEVRSWTINANGIEETALTVIEDGLV